MFELIKGTCLGKLTVTDKESLLQSLVVERKEFCCELRAVVCEVTQVSVYCLLRTVVVVVKKFSVAQALRRQRPATLMSHPSELASALTLGIFA